MTTEVHYGDYIKEMCCMDCDHAGGDKFMGHRVPPMPLTVCPECGGELKEIVGRWMYTEKPMRWWEYFTNPLRETTSLHKFVKGRQPAATEYVDS